MNVFDDDIATAQELIAEFGEICQWQKPPPVIAGAPGYPDELGPEPDAIPCILAFFSHRDLGRGTEEFLQLIANTEVPMGHEIGLLAGGLTFDPHATDTVIRANGSKQAIVKIDRLAPNGLPILYYVTVTE